MTELSRDGVEAWEQVFGQGAEAERERSRKETVRTMNAKQKTTVARRKPVDGSDAIEAKVAAKPKTTAAPKKARAKAKVPGVIKNVSEWKTLPNDAMRDYLLAHPTVGDASWAEIRRARHLRDRKKGESRSDFITRVFSGPGPRGGATAKQIKGGVRAVRVDGMAEDRKTVGILLESDQAGKLGEMLVESASRGTHAGLHAFADGTIKVTSQDGA